MFLSQETIAQISSYLTDLEYLLVSQIRQFLFPLIPTVDKTLYLQIQYAFLHWHIITKLISLKGIITTKKEGICCFNLVSYETFSLEMTQTHQNPFH